MPDHQWRILRLEPEDLAPFGRCPALREIRLTLNAGMRDKAATEEDIAALAPLDRLRVLQLSDFQFGGRALARLAEQFPELEGLQCPAGRVADGDLASIGRLTALKKLNLVGEAADDRVAAVLARSCPELEELVFAGSRNFTDAGTASLAALPNLRLLRFEGSDRVTDAGLRSLAEGAPELQSLGLMGCRVTDTGLQAFAGKTKLRNFSIQWIAAGKLTDAGLEALARCPDLESLHINQPVDATDRTLDALAALPGIKSIVLTHNGGITPEGEARFKETRPEAHLALSSTVRQNVLPDLPLDEALARYEQSKAVFLAARAALAEVGIDPDGEKAAQVYRAHYSLYDFRGMPHGNDKALVAQMIEADAKQPEESRRRAEAWNDAAKHVLATRDVANRALAKQAKEIFAEGPFTEERPLPLVSLDDDLDIIDGGMERFGRGQATGYDAVNLLVVFPRAALPIPDIRPEPATMEAYYAINSGATEPRLWIAGGPGRITLIETEDGLVEKIDGLAPSLIDPALRPGAYGGRGPRDSWQLRLPLRVPPGTKEIREIRGTFRLFRVMEEEELVFQMPGEVDKAKNANGVRMTVTYFNPDPRQQQILLNATLPLPGLAGAGPDAELMVPDLIRIVGIEADDIQRYGRGQGSWRPHPHHGRDLRDDEVGLSFEHFRLGSGIRSFRIGAASKVETMDVPFVIARPIPLPTDGRLPADAPAGPRGNPMVDADNGLTLTLAPFDRSPRSRINGANWGNGDRGPSASPLPSETREFKAKLTLEAAGGYLPALRGETGQSRNTQLFRFEGETDQGEVFARNEKLDYHGSVIFGIQDTTKGRTDSLEIAIPVPETPADRLTRLRVTMPNVYFPTEFRELVVPFDDAGNAPKTTDDPDIFVVNSRHNRSRPGAYSIYLAPPTMPDGDFNWTAGVRAVFLDADGNPIPGQHVYGYAYRIGGPTPMYDYIDEKRVRGPIVWLEASAHGQKMPARLVLSIPTAGTIRDLVAEFRDVTLPRRASPPDALPASPSVDVF